METNHYNEKIEKKLGKSKTSLPSNTPILTNKPESKSGVGNSPSTVSPNSSLYVISPSEKAAIDYP